MKVCESSVLTTALWRRRAHQKIAPLYRTHYQTLTLPQSLPQSWLGIEPCVVNKGFTVTFIGLYKGLSKGRVRSPTGQGSNPHEGVRSLTCETCKRFLEGV